MDNSEIIVLIGVPALILVVVAMVVSAALPPPRKPYRPQCHYCADPACPANMYHHGNHRP